MPRGDGCGRPQDSTRESTFEQCCSDADRVSEVGSSHSDLSLTRGLVEVSGISI